MTTKVPSSMITLAAPQDLQGVNFKSFDGTLYGQVDGTNGIAMLRFITYAIPFEFRRYSTTSAAEHIATIASNTTAPGIKFYEGIHTAAPNAANAVIKMGQMNVTGRSINAAGTFNASGADYAEYEYNNGLSIAKGDVVGFKADGTLTLTYSEAVRFGIKSTDPSFVGGDIWGRADVVGAEPVAPVPAEDENPEDFDARYQAYQQDKADFEARVELERQKVDRVAYSGKVPVNVQGATPGGYIIAAQGADGSIVGQFVADATFTQYKRAVGRVNRILEDGRAEVAVIVH